MTNQPLLNYHDAVLYSTDIDVLRDQHLWLNDACIHFQMKRYQHELHSGNGNRFLFMDPSIVSYFMHQCLSNDELVEFYEGQGILEGCTSEGCKAFCLPRQFNLKQVIFLPINDTNARFEFTPGCKGAIGTHWSLLIVILLQVSCEEDAQDRLLQPIYLHYDSVGSSSNYTAAVAVAKKLNLLFTIKKTIHGISDSTSTMQELDTSIHGGMIIRNCKTPQQINAWDCGIYVLVLTDILAAAFGRSSNKNSSDEVSRIIIPNDQQEIGIQNITDYLIGILEEILTSSKMVKNKLSFASEMREEMLYFISRTIAKAIQKEEPGAVL